MFILVSAKEMPFLPVSLKIIMHGLVCCTVISILMAGYFYYGSVPHAQTTVLTYLMRLLMIVTSSTVTWFNLLAVLLEYPRAADFWFEASPETACVFFRAEFFMGNALKCIITLFTFRLYLTLHSLRFHRMNHEKVFKITLALLITLTLLENIAIYLSNRTLCSNLRLFQILTKVHGVDLSVDAFQNTSQPPLLAIQCALTIIPEIVRKFINYKRNKKSNRIISVSGTIPMNPISNGNIFPLKEETKSFDLSSDSLQQDVPMDTDNTEQMNSSYEHNTTNLRSITPMVLNIRSLNQIQPVRQVWIQDPEIVNSVNDMALTAENDNELHCPANLINIKQVELKTSTTVCFLAFMSTTPIIHYMLNGGGQTYNLLLAMQISLSLVLHVMTVIWVINSKDILKYMKRKIKNMLDQVTIIRTP